MLGRIATLSPAAVELPRRRVLYCESFQAKPGLHKCELPPLEPVHPNPRRTHAEPTRAAAVLWTCR